MEIYDISIAPGQIRDIFCNGSYVYFYAGSAGGADATITVNQDSRGQRVLLQPGQAYRMPNGDTGTRWLIGNLRGEGTIVGRLVIGSGELTDNRVTGSVEVVDGGKSRTLVNMAFMARVGTNGGVGLFPHAQILNPAGSGKNVFVSQIFLATTVAASMGIRPYSVPLATLQNAGALSKDLSGAVSTAQLRIEGSETVLTQTGTNLYFSGDFAAGQYVNVSLREPILIRPGNGLIAYGTATNNFVTMSAEFVEEPV